MASVSTDKHGRRRILFTGIDGERKAIRLGVVSKRTAQTYRERVEKILEARESNTAIDTDVARWLGELSERMHARFVAVGLAEPRERAAVVTLGMLLDRFHAAGVIKPTTRAAYKQATDSLRAHFDAAMPLESFTLANAEAWRKAIAEPTADPDNKNEPTKTLAPATVAKRVHIAKGIFGRAVKWGLLAKSPFADIRAGSQANPDRSHYVTRADVDAILAACPDDGWRAVIALSRYAGLRCPSEITLLRWGDVNWERGRLHVRSPKTAGHEGHAARFVPIAPELRPVLQRLFDDAEPGTEAVLPRLRDPKVNLRTTFTKIITRAGVKPWPRLFHNMRASCATDWCERFPGHVVASWLGHSPLIAAKHYLQVRDSHFDAAAGNSGSDAKSDAHPDEKATQNPTQHTSASGGTHGRKSQETPCFAVVSPADARSVQAAANENNGPDWNRTSPDSIGNTEISAPGDAKSGALRGDSGSATPPASGGAAVSAPIPPAPPTDPDLAAILTAWPSLPPAIRAAVRAFVDAATIKPTP